VTDPKRLGGDTIVRVYDRNISRGDFEHDMRKFNLALAIGLTDYASQLSGGSEQGAADFAINAIIIEQEGRKLGIKPTDEEIKDAIMAMPSFQTGGQFDRNKYAMITQITLSPQGLTEIDLDNLVGNALTFDRIKKILDSAPVFAEVEAANFQRVFQPVNGIAVIFDRADFAKNVKITDAQIADYFKENAARFVTPEWRTASYVRFPLPADAAKLEGKAKIDAQQKVADASDAFATKAATEGFEKAAKEAGLKVETTLPFDPQGNIKSIAGLDAAAAAGPAQALAPAVFTLSEKSPVSGVIQSGNEFLVADLGEVTPARPMTLDETRPGIVQQLTDTAAQAALDKTAAETLASLRAAVKSGKPFAQAAAAAGLKTQPFANLSLVDEASPADQRKYADSAIVLDENEISGLRREAAGGFAVWLEKRLPVDQKKFDEHGKEATTGILEQRKNVLWHDWINHAQKAAGLRFGEGDRG
jgi:peptidyl-prolyl cis-trans isomerase D